MNDVDEGGDPEVANQAPFTISDPPLETRGEASAEAEKPSQRGIHAATRTPALPRRPLRVLTLAEIRSRPPRGYIVKRLMAPSELSVWYGPPKSGKSFFMLSLAYAIAQSRSFFGRRVHGCPVLYVATEGESGTPARLAALEAKYGFTDRFFLVAQSVDLLKYGADVEKLIEIAKELRVGLVVVDTVNRAMAGGDENSSTDMGSFIAVLDRIRAGDGDWPGAHVAVVHHGTKNGSGGPRGHGSLVGAADLVVEITDARNGDLRTAIVTHAKDDPAGDRIAFRLEVINLGPDEDGDPCTTCIALETNAPDKPSKCHLSPSALRTLEKLKDCIAGPTGAELPRGDGFPTGVRGVLQNIWLKARDDHVRSDTKGRESRMRVLRRDTQQLRDAGLVVAHDGWWWVAAIDPDIRTGSDN